MSLTKACCPKCKEKGKLSFFEVSLDADLCYCPVCMEKLNPKVAARTYEKYRRDVIHKSNLILFDRIDALAAYKEYANILDIDPSIVEARYGRILALITMSTLRKSTFSQATELFDSESSLYYRKIQNYADYFLFLHRMCLLCQRYLIKVKKKISFSNYYYDYDCLKLYLQRNKEMANLLDLVENEMVWLSGKYENKDLKKDLKEIDKVLKIVNANFSLDKKHVLSDGSVYTFLKFNRGEPLLKRNESTISNKWNSRHVPTLVKQKGHPYIKDVVVRNNRFVMDFYRISLVILLVLTANAIGVGTAAIFLRHQAHYLWIACLIAFVVSMILVNIVLAFIFVSRRTIKKRHEMFGLSDAES